MNNEPVNEQLFYGFSRYREDLSVKYVLIDLFLIIVMSLLDAVMSCDVNQGLLVQSLANLLWFLARLYESTGRAIAVTPASALALALTSALL